MDQKTTCHICGKIFSKSQNLKRHLKFVHKTGGPLKMFSCEKCDYVTVRSDNLKKHEKIHDPNKAKKARFHQVFDISGLPKPDSPLINNEQIEELISEEGYSEEAAKLLAEQWGIVRTRYLEGKYRRHYTMRLKSEDIDRTEIVDLLLKIHDLQMFQYKLNISWGCLLQHIETKEWRFFHPHIGGRQYWPKPEKITNREDLMKVIEFMDKQDIVDHLTIQRPNTKWALRRVVNFCVIIYVLQEHALLGHSSSVLPQHVLKHQYILTLLKKTNGIPFKDKLCIFRCISYHLFGGKKLQTNAKKLAEQFRKHENIPREKFTGEVTLNQMYQLEKCFGLKISVHTLVRDTTLNDDAKTDETSQADKFVAKLIRNSTRKVCESENGELFLDLTKNHLSVITSIQNYARTFKCNICRHAFNRNWKARNHQAKCFKSLQSRAKYFGGAYKMVITVFDKLELLNIKVEPEDRFSPYFSAYDFETVNKIVAEDKKMVTEKLTYEKVLELCSCSVISSVPGFVNSVFIYRQTTVADFMKRFIDYLDKIATQAEILQRERLGYLFEQLETKISQTREKLNNSTDPDIRDFFAVTLKRCACVQKELEQYVQRHMFYAFNGSRFDIKVAKVHLVDELVNNRNMPIQHTIKRHGGYAMLNTEKFSFKDMASLLGPGTSLQNFFKSFDLPVCKWSFPYDYITDLDTLDETEFPPYSAFWNSLKNCYLVTEEQYDEIAQWYKQNANCLWDYMKEYNNRDVVSMKPGLEKLRQFWKTYDICMLNQGISLSSLSSKLMFGLVPDDKPFVWLPDKDTSFVFKMGEESIVGGPALVWTRYAEKDKTFIRKGSIKCQGVLGLDAAALYLSCLAKEMPTSYAVHWKPNESSGIFEKNILIPKWTSIPEIEYCFWIQHETKDPKLCHVYNYGQAYIGKNKAYRPDAYSARDNKVYHFFGCYFHFCDTCQAGKKRTEKAPDAAKKKKTEDAKMLQYFAKLEFDQVVMRECEWNHFKRTNVVVAEFLDQKLGMPLRHRNRLTKSDVIEKIVSGELFGMARISLHVPDHLYENFKEFCPIFKNRIITRDDLSPYALKIAEANDLLMRGQRSLISVMKADKIVLVTPLIKWYIEHGLVVTEVYDVVQFKPAKIFTNFAESVTKHRKSADEDDSKKQLGNLHKLSGNAAYGKTLERRSEFTNVKFENEKSVSKKINLKEFVDLEELHDDLFEITMAKRSYIDSVPRIIGAMVLGYAKLRLLEMYYDFLDKYFDRSTWELVCADTDSLYMSIAANDLESFEKLVRPEKLEEYKSVRPLFLSTDKSTQRNPGLFKQEFLGTGIVSLAPKVYFAWNESTNEEKKSCKGINQRDSLEKQKYLDVLHSQSGMEFINTGFRCVNNKMYQYRQRKTGLMNFYIKRKLNDDGVTTEPLIS